MTMANLLRVMSLATALVFAGAPTGRAAGPAWVANWSASPAPWRDPAVLQNETVREIVHTTAGGREVRLRLSNAYGATRLRIDAVSLALREAGARIRPGSSAPVTFQGQRAVTIAPGAYVLSDPVAFEAPAQSDLAVSLYLAGPASVSTVHAFQRDAVYFAQGDATDQAAITPVAAPATGQAYLWLDQVEVAGGEADGAVVAFGDSITDGTGPAAGTHGDWPDVLYARLRAAGLTRLSVANAGIGGDRLLHPGFISWLGEAGAARFDRDVLAQPNVRAVIIYIGINDIGQVGSGAGPEQYVSAEGIEHGLAQLAERAHERGLKVYAGTLTPFKPDTYPGYYSDAKETERQAVNAWIRQTSLFDGVADFDKALEDPSAPGRLRPLYDSGDHLHPSAAGDQAIADAVPLDWFR
jgi:lysophospholipase L1-like esterase